MVSLTAELQRIEQQLAESQLPPQPQQSCSPHPMRGQPGEQASYIEGMGGQEVDRHIEKTGGQDTSSHARGTERKGAVRGQPTCSSTQEHAVPAQPPSSIAKPMAKGRARAEKNSKTQPTISAAGGAVKPATLPRRSTRSDSLQPPPAPSLTAATRAVAPVAVALVTRSHGHTVTVHPIAETHATVLATEKHHDPPPARKRRKLALLSSSSSDEAHTAGVPETAKASGVAGAAGSASKEGMTGRAAEAAATATAMDGVQGAETPRAATRQSMQAAGLVEVVRGTEAVVPSSSEGVGMRAHARATLHKTGPTPTPVGGKRTRGATVAQERPTCSRHWWVFIFHLHVCGHCQVGAQWVRRCGCFILLCRQ